MKKIYIDLETTGFSSEDDIIQIAALVVDGVTVVNYVSEYFMPERVLTAEVIAVTGLDPFKLGALSKGKKFKDCAQDIIDRLIPDEECELIAHNLDFDDRLLTANLFRAGVEYPMEIVSKCCTMKTYKHRLPNKGHGPKLSNLVRYAVGRFNKDMRWLDRMYVNQFGKEPQFHDALYDTFCCYMSDIILRRK